MTGFHDLLKGFGRFRKTAYESDDAPMPRLVEQGQDPDYFIISCIDSRSNPGTIFRAPPGTFFAHKAMGAIVRPYKQGTALAAALQFAVKYNNVHKIIVLGHTGCGAIQAMIEKTEDEEIASFVAVAKEGLENAKRCCPGHGHPDLPRRAEEQIVLLSAKNLQTYPVVKQGLENGTLDIASWLFDMEQGALYSHDPVRDEFLPLSTPDSRPPDARTTRRA